MIKHDRINNSTEYACSFLKLLEWMVEKVNGSGAGINAGDLVTLSLR